MWERVGAWFFPVSCIGCEANGIALCAACAPAPADRVVDVVADVGLAAAGEYDGVLRRAIVAMKRGERAYLEPLGELLARSIVAQAALVPLPTTRRRVAARGFDQAVEIARRAAARCDVRCAEVLVKRGGPQRGLGRRARLEAGHRFRVKTGVVLPERALVVDDVCTTGATLADGIATLRAAGVTIMGAVVLARTAAGRNSRLRAAVLPDGRHVR